MEREKMSDSKNRTSNGAVEQIMRNMTSDLHNAEGQYIQLGFPATPAAPSQESWQTPLPPPPQQHPYISPFNVHTTHSSEHSMPYSLEHPYAQQQVAFNYVSQQSHMYNQDLYGKQSNDVNFAFPNHHSVHQDVMFSPEYKLFMAQKVQVPDHNFMPNHHFTQNHQDLLNSNPNRSPLLENLAGNWTPNTSGTYSPFGNNAALFNGRIFEPSQDMDTLSNNMVHQVLEEPRIELDEAPTFQFHRDTKKPRMVAEVKPMRPSYSDVLLKSAPLPNPKTAKSEQKESKPKKDTKKNTKADKLQKSSSLLNRSNTSNEIKDIGDKTLLNKSSDKLMKESKNNTLHRKWNSLDNVTESSIDFKLELNDSRKAKKALDSLNKGATKLNQRKVGRQEFNDTDSGGGGRNDSMNTSKSSVKKGSKTRQRNPENSFGTNERPPGKRSQRNRKRDNQVPFGFVGQKCKEYLGWWKYILKFVLWLYHLVSDVFSMSMHLSKDMGTNFYFWFIAHWALFLDTSMTIIKRIRMFTWIYEKFKKEKEPEKKPGFANAGLQSNIQMPTTGDEAMKRLLACKGKDPYSILGVTPTCTDSDIKNYYKKQAKLVHPDKNQQPGAEEAFKILVRAFDMIGEPERRATYDRGVAESVQAEQVVTELTELLVKLQQKVEAAANTIRCSACYLRHKRIRVDRQCYSARNCKMCKIYHSAKEGDIWAEARCFGFLWHYYACMDGGVYDITEWAACQKDSLKHLKPDCHNVQYRIALGKQPNGQPRRHAPQRNHQDPDLDSIINSLYGHTGAAGEASTAANQSTAQQRRKTKKSK